MSTPRSATDIIIAVAFHFAPFGLLTVVGAHLLGRLLYPVEPELLVDERGEVGRQRLPEVEGQRRRRARRRRRGRARRRRRGDDGEGAAQIQWREVR